MRDRGLVPHTSGPPAGSVRPDLVAAPATLPPAAAHGGEGPEEALAYFGPPNELKAREADGRPPRQGAACPAQAGAAREPQHGTDAEVVQDLRHPHVDAHGEEEEGEDEAEALVDGGVPPGHGRACAEGVHDGQGDGGDLDEAVEEGRVEAETVGEKCRHAAHNHDAGVVDQHGAVLAHEEEAGGDGPELVADLQLCEHGHALPALDALGQPHLGKGRHGQGEVVGSQHAQAEVDSEVGDLVRSMQGRYSGDGRCLAAPGGAACRGPLSGPKSCPHRDDEDSEQRRDGEGGGAYPGCGGPEVGLRQEGVVGVERHYLPPHGLVAAEGELRKDRRLDGMQRLFPHRGGGGG